MALETKAEEMIEQLRGAFVQTIRIAVAGLPPHEALQLADALCTAWLETLQGLRVIHRQRPQINASAIKEDWARGLSVAEILQKYRCSKATAYRYHPARQGLSKNSLTKT